MKIDRSYGNYEKETYKPTPTVGAWFGVPICLEYVV